MPTSTTYTRQAPWMETLIRDLYGTAQGQVRTDAGYVRDPSKDTVDADGRTIPGWSDTPTNPAQLPPAYQVAGLSPLEMQAAGTLQGGIGSWAPYLQEAQGGVRAGMGAIGEAGIPMMQQGYNTIGQAQQLAGMTRGVPYQYRNQAMGQLGQAQAHAAATRGTPYQYRDQAMGQLGQAQDLAASTRGIPYQYRNQAMGELGQAQGMLGQAQGLAESTRGTPYQYRDQGIGALQGAMGGFDPSTISEFYDPYAEEVIAAQQADVERLGQRQRSASNASAAAAGAFGGSRGYVEQAEIGRNVLGEQSRIGAQLRSQGYQQARQSAQQAFEAQKGRQMAAGQGIGQLGLQYGQLGQQDVAQQAALAQARGQMAQARGQMGLQYGQLGQQDVAQQAALAQARGQMGLQYGQLGQQDVAQMADLAKARGQMGLQYGQLGQQDVAQLAALGQARGQMGQGIGALGTSLGALGMQQAQLGEGAQRMNMADVNSMMQLGGVYRGQQQAELEALRRSQSEAQKYPYQQMAYLADLFKSNPSGTYSMLTEPTAPAPSNFQQWAGLGIGALGAASGAKYAGLFG
jgi:hypothetical protein